MPIGGLNESAAEADRDDDGRLESMRQFAILAFLTAAACGDRQSPAVEAATVDGVPVLRQAGFEPGKLAVTDAVERRGTFQLRGRCLVLSAEGSDYAPVFTNHAAELIALGDARGGRTLHVWSLSGEPMPPAAGEERRQAGSCGNPFFVVLGLSNPR